MTSDAPNPPDAAARAVPFRGLRFADAATIGERTFVPPQSWSESAEVGDSGLDPYHLLRLLDPVLGSSGRRDNAEQVAELLDRWAGDGVLVEDPPSMYVYRRDDGERSLVGVVVAARLRDGDRPGLLPHEEVLGRLVEAQGRLERVSRAQLEPIVAIRSGGQDGATPLRQIVSGVLDTRPLYRIDESGTRDELWAVHDADVHRAVGDATQDSDLLIADGHHRYAAWSAEAITSDRPGAAHPSGFALTMLVDATDSGLRLGSVHRVVRDIGLDEAVSSIPVDTTTLADAQAAREFLASGPAGRSVFAAEGRFVAVTPGTDARPVCASPECAVCWLHEEWLDAWGAGDARVEYVHAVDSALALARERNGLAVLLPSPGLGTVLDAAGRGAPLPHKATSFGPKPRVGLVMRRWDEDLPTT